MRRDSTRIAAGDRPRFPAEPFECQCSPSYRATHLKEVEMLHRTSAVARVSVPPSRAGPSLMISLAAATLALLVAATAGGQAPAPQLTHSTTTPLTDSGKSRADADKKPSDTAAA